MEPPEDIIFESRDTEIFNIPDTKTKLNTLQNYFFPRLQKLLDAAILLIRDIYQIDPLERYSFVYRPSHRKDAKDNAAYNEVYIGIAGKRNVNKQLLIKRPDGNYYSFHPTYLYFSILPTGEIYVELLPFRYYVDKAYIHTVKSFLIENYEAFLVLMNTGKLSYDSGEDFKPVMAELKNRFDFKLSSASHYFPIENQEAIHALILSFALLFPILDACRDLAEGIKPSFSTHIDNLRSWLKRHPKIDHVTQSLTLPKLPELDSYKFVRAGL